MKKLIFLSILLFICFMSFAKGRKDKNHCREIITQSADTIIKAKILTADSKLKPSSSKQYFWYLNGAIGSNYGGYTGKLLHLDYTALLNDKLVRSGSFNKGLKDGWWISWYENGMIKEIYSYRKGALYGKYFLFDDAGNNMSKGRYKDGKFHNKFSLKEILKNKSKRTKNK